MVRMERYLGRVMQLLDVPPRRPAVEISVAAGEVRLDRGRARLVGLIVAELGGNAIRHAFPGGRAGRVSVELSRSGGRYTLSVSDTGIGIASALPTDPAAVGLRLVQLYAQRLRACIRVDVSGGSRFTLGFPAALQDSPP
jgi:two-component sensor histidine kinase